MNLLKCVNFPTYLRRSIHTQTRCLSAQCVLCDGLRNDVAAILGNHRAADSKQHVFRISSLPAVSTRKFSSFGQFPKSPQHYFTGATQEVLLLWLLQRISVDCPLLPLTHHLQAQIMGQALWVLHRTELKGWVLLLRTLRAEAVRRSNALNSRCGLHPRKSSLPHGWTL